MSESHEFLCCRNLQYTGSFPSSTLETYICFISIAVIMENGRGELFFSTPTWRKHVPENPCIFTLNVPRISVSLTEAPLQREPVVLGPNSGHHLWRKGFWDEGQFPVLATMFVILGLYSPDVREWSSWSFCHLAGGSRCSSHNAHNNRQRRDVPLLIGQRTQINIRAWCQKCRLAD